MDADADPMRRQVIIALTDQDAGGSKVEIADNTLIISEATKGIPSIPCAAGYGHLTLVLDSKPNSVSHLRGLFKPSRMFENGTMSPTRLPKDGPPVFH